MKNNNQNEDQNIDADYKRIVKEAAKKEENLDIPNNTLDHAVFLSQTLISKAETDIKILTGELSSPYYNRVKGQLETVAEKFNSSKGKIKIVILDKDAPENHEFQELIAKYRDVIEVKNAHQSSEVSETFSHFLVSDRKRYRLEKPHTKEELCREEVKGTANFGNFGNAKILDVAFDKLWDEIRD